MLIYSVIRVQNGVWFVLLQLISSHYAKHFKITINRNVPNLLPYFTFSANKKNIIIVVTENKLFHLQKGFSKETHQIKIVPFHQCKKLWILIVEKFSC